MGESLLRMLSKHMRSTTVAEGCTRTHPVVLIQSQGSAAEVRLNLHRPAGRRQAALEEDQGRRAEPHALPLPRPGRQWAGTVVAVRTHAEDGMRIGPLHRADRNLEAAFVTQEGQRSPVGMMSSSCAATSVCRLLDAGFDERSTKMQ